MKRRKFIQWTVVSGLTLVCMPLYGEKPFEKKLWIDTKTTKFSKVVEELYGKRKITPNHKIVVKTPRLASNGGAVPIHISSEIEATKVTVLSEEGEEKIIGTFDVPKDTIVDYLIKSKFPSAKVQTIWVILEDMKGNLYSNFSSFETALAGGCEG